KVSGNHRSEVDGVRWYELRNGLGSGSTPTVYQSGTYNPNDGQSRWMGSAAMDKLGNIAVGYSASGPSSYPSIRYAVRVPTDALGTLEAENVLKDGNGAQ